MALSQYISITEFLMGRIAPEELTPEQMGNMNTIVPAANQLLDAFGEYRACNSGYRSSADQDRINPGAPHSKHLICAAIDLNDPDGKLNQFCKDNESLLESLGLWCEVRQGGWQHCQCIPPISGHRWFIP